MSDQLDEMKDQTFTDPVCGMAVQPAHAAGTSVHEGTTHYFCAAACKKKFDSDPSRFTVSVEKEGACCSSAPPAISSCCRG